MAIPDCEESFLGRFPFCAKDEAANFAIAGLAASAESVESLARTVAITD